jgi:hypothetical protein
MTTSGSEAKAGDIGTAEADACALARRQFEDLDDMRVGLLAGEPNDTQQALLRWQADRFGALDALHGVRMALGVIEEMAETFEAETAAEALDGLGDVIVYAGQLAAFHRLSIGPILALADAYLARGARVQILAAGSLAHHVLKGSQKIRGLDDPDLFRLGLVEKLAEAIACAVETVAIGHVEGAINVAEVYRIVGTEVLQRKAGDKMIPAADRLEVTAEARAKLAAELRAERKAAALVQLGEAGAQLAEEALTGGHVPAVHSHPTRNVYEPGECAACDVNHANPRALAFDVGGDS